MTKEQLRDILTLNERINSKQRQIDELRRTAQSVQDFMRIAEIDSEITADIDHLVDARRAARS